jgi:nitrite reductase (NO-forming)
MRTINPGEELTYSFEATHAGVFMYHCGTAPALHHIGNAMHGLIVVDPADGLPDVDHEFFFVQHEYYLGPQGEPGDLDEDGADRRRARPRGLQRRGRTSTCTNRSRSASTRRIRAWVVNNGPSADSSFHVVGTIFDAVVKEGVELRADNPGRWGSQALDLAPAQGGYVEFSSPTTGSTRSSPTRSTTSAPARSACSRPATGGEAVAGGH